MSELTEQLAAILPTGLEGSVVRMVGTTAAVADFPAPLGALVEIQRPTGLPVPAEVIGFREQLTLVYPLAEMTGVRQGNRVRVRQSCRWLAVGQELLGRVIDAHGRCIDGRPQPALPHRTWSQEAAPSP